MASDPETLRERARVQMGEGNFSEAVRLCRRLLLSKPSDLDTRLLLGRALLELGRLKEVRVEMIGLMRGESPPGGAYLLHAEACYQAGDVSAAAECLRLYLDRVPEDMDAQKLLERVETDELQNQGTVARWFDPLAGATVEVSAPEIVGEKTTVSSSLSLDDEEVVAESMSTAEITPGMIELPSSSLESVIVDSDMIGLPTPSSEVNVLESSELELLESGSQSYGSMEPVIVSEEYVAEEPTRVRISERDLELDNGHGAISPVVEAGPVSAVLAEFPAGRDLHSSPGPIEPLEAAPTRIRAPSPNLSDPMPEDLSVPPVQAQPPQAHAPPSSVTTTAKSLAIQVGRWTRGWGRMGHAVVAGAVAVVFLVAIFIYMEATSDVELLAAMHQATDDGRPLSLDRALALLEEDGGGDDVSQARRARLLAMATFEHGADHIQEVEQILAALDTTTDLGGDAVIARTYIQLVRNEPAEATRTLSVISTTQEHAAEIARVRSIAAHAIGDLDQAVAHASDAVGHEPVSSRHVSWLAILTALNGNAAAGLATLEGVTEGASAPNVRVARARILQDSGSDPDGARRESEAVLNELASTASPAERGWAELVRARVLASRGERDAAREAALRAQELRPAGDVAYYYEIIAALLQVRDTEAASAEIREMPAFIRETEQGALARAEVALLNRDLDELSTALESSGTGGLSEYLRGRLFEARDDWGRANEFYERAERHAEVRARAKSRRAGILLRQGQPEPAEALLRPLWERGVVEAEVATVWVRTRLDLQDVDGAAEALSRSRSQFGDLHELMVQQLRLSLVRRQSEEALQLAERLVESRPRDAGLQVLRYRAAGAEGNTEIAAAAFEAASRAGRSSPAVLIDLALAAQALSDRNAMQIAVQSAERAGAPPDRLRSVRGRLLVLGGRGMVAVAELLQIPEDVRGVDDWASLIRAYTQAEQENDARAAIERVPEHFEARLALSVIAIRGGVLGRGEGLLRVLTERSDLTSDQRARSLAYSALITFEEGDRSQARQILDRAARVDPRCSQVHLIRADIAADEGRPERLHLQAAVDGTTPVPEAVGRLALDLGSGAEACRLAESYISAAPRGYDARSVRAISCP